MRYFAAPRLLQNVTRQRLRSNVRNLDNPRQNIKNDLYDLFFGYKGFASFFFTKISFHVKKVLYNKERRNEKM